MKSYRILISGRIIEKAEEYRKEMLKKWENTEMGDKLKSLDLEYFITWYIEENCK